MRNLEHQIQAAFFDYVDIKYSCLRSRISIFAIPNGGARSVITGKMLKKEGVSKGVFDVFCCIPKGEYHGLWIEFKSGKNKLTTEQKEFCRARLEDGFSCEICYSVGEAIEVLENYLETTKND